MKRLLAVGVTLLTLAAVFAVAQPGFGKLYYDGRIVRTIVPPAANPQMGKDNLYVVMGGATGQLAVAAVAPGDREYHGGKWAFHEVTWNTSPYLLTSEAEVLAAESAGDVTVTRLPGNDFKCPIQP
ncbi:MAG: hypothetical protein JSW58_12860 [Candidatus Latescibacterota bacterium]|nr:MAG: hypothetical protein JSW58_12860 [Candidatus Latescibacterota bacterium]